MITFYNFPLKIETSWAKKVVRTISEIWNANDVIVCLVYSFSDKNNFKSTKLKKKNNIK